MGFFESEIVQQEAKKLFEDYQALMQLGSSYGKFDRDGKVLYIEQMEAIMDRYRIFMKRFELADDFMAQMTMEQMKTQLNQFGITPQQMFDQMHKTLERMRADVEKQV
jgi:phosphoribosyl 1,2-cyclic phosphodiesterase